MILITRPAEKAAALQQFLSRHGLESHITPLVKFAQINNLDLINQLNQLTSSDFLIAISENAVKFANNLLQQQHLSWPTGPRYIAVGTATGRLWQELLDESGFQGRVILPRQATSEGVLDLPQLQQIRGQTGLILRGLGGRELLFESLSQRGAQMQYQEVYRRVPVTLPADQTRRWQQLGIETVVLTSGELLTLFDQQARSDPEWARELRLIVPSARVAQQAQQAGYRRVQVAGGADHQAVYRAICQEARQEEP